MISQLVTVCHMVTPGKIKTIQYPVISYQSFRCYLASFLFSSAICFHFKISRVPCPLLLSFPLFLVLACNCFLFLCSWCLLATTSCPSGFLFLPCPLQISKQTLSLVSPFVFPFPLFLDFPAFVLEIHYSWVFFFKKEFCRTQCSCFFHLQLDWRRSQLPLVQFEIPSEFEFELELPRSNGHICAPSSGCLGLYKGALWARLRLPIPPFVLEFF